MYRLGTVSLALLVASTLAWASPAAAHLDMTDPPPRLGGRAGRTQLKNGPCGQSTNARTDNVTVYEPGATITVRWDEYINHPSYYRISFDVDGDDDFPIRADMDSVIRTGDDPAAANPVGDVVLMYVTETPGTSSYAVDVTLPDVECENCTLQVIQFMYDKLGDGRDNEYYFQCADIALRAAGTTPDAGSSSGSDAGAGGGGDAGVGPGADAGSTTTSSGGCTIARGGPRRVGFGLGLCALALLRSRRRRR